MKKTPFWALALFLAVGAASAQTKIPAATSTATVTQKWTKGWDIFTEPLDLVHSNVQWSVASTKKLTVKPISAPSPHLNPYPPPQNAPRGKEIAGNGSLRAPPNRRIAPQST